MAFASTRSGNGDIYTMPFPPSGSATALVTHSSIDAFPDW
jgi:hypothetical protein